MPITISSEQIIVVIGSVAGAVTAIFHFAMYIGRLTNRIERVERRVDDHDEHLFGRRASDHSKVQL
jgi:hypothetical protein